MYFKQSDIFWGLDRSFIKAVMNIARKESYNRGDFLFQVEDRAESFFILLKGRVKLTIGENGHSIYTVCHPGEAFGWSSLVGRQCYSASAECREPTILMNIEAKKMLEIFEKNATLGFVFYKRLASLLGNRLLHTYRMISSVTSQQILSSYGTGQDTEWDTTIV